MSRRAFTLVELMVVLLILALAAGAVTLRLNTQGRLARMADVVDSLKNFERQGRLMAQRRGQACLVSVDLAKGTFSRSDPDGRGDWGEAWQAPEGFVVAKLWVGPKPSDHGQVSIPCSAGGCTPSYGLHLVGPKDQQAWIVVAGLTGAWMELENEKQLSQILAASRPRANAG